MPTTETTERPRRTAAGTLDLTPTWTAVVPVLVAAIQDGTDTGRRLAIEELYRLARIADNANAGRPIDDGVPD